MTIRWPAVSPLKLAARNPLLRVLGRGSILFGDNLMVYRLKSAISARTLGLRTRPPIIMCIGDSNGTGEGSGTGGTANLNDSYKTGPFQQITTTAPTLGGLPVRKTAVFGEGNSGNNAIPVGTYNPMITLGSGWDRDAATGPIGGRFLDGQIGSGFITINLGAACDTIEVHYPVNTTLSTALGVYASDNTLVGTINQAGTAAINVSQFTSSKFADGIVKLRNDGAALALFSGVIGWLSTENAVILAQGTWSGAKVADYAATTQPWTGLGHLANIKPDLTIIQLTMNDINQGTAAATYGSSMDTIITACLLWGDILLSTGFPGGTANYTSGTLHLQTERVILQKAAQNGGGFISLHREFDNYTSATAAGYTSNTLHMTATGYAKQAAAYALMLQRMVA